MKLENQVCSLELSKKLKELGVKQESLFWWELEKGDTPEGFLIRDGHGKNFNIILDDEYEFIETDINEDRYDYYSAFTVAELGEMLPDTHFNFYKNEDGYLFSGHSGNITEKNEANARAKMLIYLLENNLIENK